MKVAVVGAGVGGLSTAWWLARGGHEVTVIDRSHGVALEFRSKALEGDPGRFAKMASRLVEKLDETLKTSSRGIPARAGTEILGTLRGT